MEKHTIAMAWCRKLMKRAEAIFHMEERMLSAEDVAEKLQQFKVELTTEIFALLDDLLARDRL